ncbi:hypothetical protein NM688_g3542 [Phlebia brevispora]|uniref:Uncharacterized protein n=1 Tax=Phlebia brevispora TaxID=194682 RepID=A0ACC1T5L8_9APHY|nr:hypothetical protein NM688_g3542 [Phlebia brevispora]
MVSLRVPISVNAGKKQPRYISGVLYKNNVSYPSPVKVLTEIPRDENERVLRYPCFEAILGTSTLVQDCAVMVSYERRAYNFLLAAQWLPQAPDNRALREVVSDVAWKGSIVVMKMGDKILVTNLTSSKDKIIAREAVKK